MHRLHKQFSEALPIFLKLENHGTCFIFKFHTTLRGIKKCWIPNDSLK